MTKYLKISSEPHPGFQCPIFPAFFNLYFANRHLQESKFPIITIFCFSFQTLKGGMCGSQPVLPRPLDCPEFLFDMMRHCWLLDPMQRPTFGHLRETLEKLVRNSHMLNEKYNFEYVLLLFHF